jgi:hypothetical protein
VNNAEHVATFVIEIRWRIVVAQYRLVVRTMLIEFDQNTLANMTAALEFVCKRIPPDRDTPEIRKQIADEMIASAKSGRRTYVDFQDAGTRLLAEIIRPQRFRWLGWFHR